MSAHSPIQGPAGMNPRLGMILAALMGLGVSCAWAQTDTPAADDKSMESMDHTMHGAGHDVRSADQNATPDTDHSMDHGSGHSGHQTDHSATPGGEHGMTHGTDAQGADKDSTDHSGHGMNQGAAQGDPAPSGPRDPHAYSGGYTLVSGPYALPGPRRLHFADEHNFGSLLVDRFEAVWMSDNPDTAATYDLQASYGRDFDRAVLKAEGHYADDGLEEAGTELLWSHAVASYWNTQLGLRYDSGEGPDRAWLAGGIQGLAPYWFEVDLTAYAGDEGRTAVNAEAEYELLLTQRLILQPRLEATAYGKSDPQRGLGSGLSELAAGARLRYEIRREIAPYVGIERSARLGATADYAREAGDETYQTRYVAGVRFWF